ncbi:hypothetical protein ACLMAL_16015 [Nocardia sp. CWNU-33]|uniref:hypothetical protein n=1 Tax=Nocardia sp. CWNU-33 TaxID=3392117 RepID=UPI00398F5F32
MNGFDDRRNDPTVLGQPSAAHQQQPYGPGQFGPEGDDGGQTPPNQQWAPPPSAAHPEPTLQWQPAAPPQPDPTLQWQPGGQPPLNQQWGSGSDQQPPPDRQWQPVPDGPTPPAHWAPGGSAQFEPTLLRQPAPGAQTPQNQQFGPGAGEHTPQNPQWTPTPSGSAQPEPTYQWQPAPGAQNQQWGSSAGQQTPQSPQWAPSSTGSAQPEPTLQWQPAAPPQPEPTLQWQPSSGAQAQPEPTLQWQPAAPAQPAQYGEVPPIEQFPANQYGAAPQAYGAPVQHFPPGYGPHGRPSGGHGKAWLAAAAAAIVVAGGAIAAVVVADRGSDDTRAQDTSPSMVSALTPTAGAQPSATKPTGAKPAPTGTGTRNEPSVVPGYQVVVSPDRGAAYDVPADWTVASEGTIGGFGEPPNAVVGKGYASEGKSYCPGSTRTVSFLTGSKDSDSASAATEVGTKTAKLAYHDAPATPSGGQPLSSLDGSQHGMFVETKGTIPQAKPGCATEYSVYTFATPTENGSFVMVIAADTGVPKAVDVATAMQIFSSVRAHEG